MEPADDTGPAVDLSPHWHVQVGLRDPTSVVPALPRLRPL